MINFYLGAHGAHWLWHPKPASLRAPLFVAIRTLARLKTWHRALVPFCIDANAFTQVSQYGRFLMPAQEYAELAVRVYDEIGEPDFVSIQDWMCEEEITDVTGYSVEKHQNLTLESFLLLRELAPSVKWLPVIQGYTLDEYITSIEMYYNAGIELHTYERVGIGSVCKRQHTAEIFAYLKVLSLYRLRFHGFGVKTKALERILKAGEPLLVSADSMAWSKHARKRPQLPGCNHKHGDCNGCIRYALRWRQNLLAQGLAI